MEIIALKLKENFLDVICKVESTAVDDILSRQASHFTATAPLFVHFTPVQENGHVVGHQPNMQPINTFTDSPSKDTMVFSMDDIFTAYRISDKAENMYREAIGDVTIARNNIVMP